MENNLFLLLLCAFFSLQENEVESDPALINNIINFCLQLQDSLAVCRVRYKKICFDLMLRLVSTWFPSTGKGE